MSETREITKEEREVLVPKLQRVSQEMQDLARQFSGTPLNGLFVAVVAVLEVTTRALQKLAEADEQAWSRDE